MKTLREDPWSPESYRPGVLYNATETCRINDIVTGENVTYGGTFMVVDPVDSSTGRYAIILQDGRVVHTSTSIDGALLYYAEPLSRNTTA